MKKTGNLYRNTAFRNGGRKAGSGVLYDDYSEDAYTPDCEQCVHVRLPHDGIPPEMLNGPVICYKEK